jgi:hypothetical protein
LKKAVAPPLWQQPGSLSYAISTYLIFLLPKAKIDTEDKIVARQKLAVSMPDRVRLYLNLFL